MAEGAHFTVCQGGMEPSAGLFLFYHLENTSDSFKQQAGKYHKHFDLFCRRAPFINNNGKVIRNAAGFRTSSEAAKLKAKK